VRRGDRTLVPRGTDRVQPGERVLLVASTAMASRIDDIVER
jgi:Trk K+ transport system NAD-binding subunit